MPPFPKIKEASGVYQENKKKSNAIGLNPKIIEFKVKPLS